MTKRLATALAIALAIALALALAVWAMHGNGPEEPPGTTAPGAQAGPPEPPGPHGDKSAEPHREPAEARQSAASAPQPAQAMDFLRFQQSVVDFQQGRDTSSVQERQDAARAILEGLPGMVRSGYVLPIQALMLGNSLVNEAASGVADRAALASSLRVQIEEYSAQSVGPSPDQDPRFQRYQLQSMQIVEAVNRTLPPEQRQAAIAAQLQKLREQIYDGAPPRR